MAVHPSFSRHKIPEGFAFEIAELMILRNWAENRGLEISIKLDHAERGQEYEEYVRLQAAGSRISPICLWRSADAVMIVPFGSKPRRFISMAHALSALQLRNGVIELRQSRTGG